MLKFLTIDDRHSAIPEAHRRTFEWIWTDQDRPLLRNWSNFWKWLTTGKGVYWISGKAGSGKSTLMKYIHHEARTSQGLQQWAENTEFVTAAFFFWNGGSPMQKSLLGLLQSMLYEILLQKPNLKEKVFPETVQEEVSARWKSRHPGSDTIWRAQDLKDAFKRLLETSSLKICLFIDGLDEYDGEDSEVAELFQSIVTSPSIKACLSSRPHPTFERSFSTCPRLRLQDLTYQDISLYVREKFEGREEILRISLTDPSEFQDLLEEIISKAAGVFLWVTLAVRSFLEGLTNYDRLSDLRLRLKDIPEDLSQLYWHMLRSIKPAFYFGQAAKLLRIMQVATTENYPLRVDELAFAEDYEPGKKLVRVDDSKYREYAKEQARIMEGRLMSRCLGLLEVHQGTVTFLHQSVSEFLSQADVKSSLDKNVQGPFSPHSCLLAAILTRTKYSHVFRDYRSEGGQSHMNLMFSLARKAEGELKTVSDGLTDEINSIMTTPSRYERIACLGLGSQLMKVIRGLLCGTIHSLACVYRKD
ncbi:hypothetical protein ABW20_dc0105730 [Dactylellina cionopaga]|nr:hypothetical protein ABW20_dc0105730 [Dactylellina cionopaga]